MNQPIAEGHPTVIEEADEGEAEHINAVGEDVTFDTILTDETDEDEAPEDGEDGEDDEPDDDDGAPDA